MHERMIDTYWFKYQKHPQIILIFDLKSYKEQSPLYFCNSIYPPASMPKNYDSKYPFKPLNLQSSLDYPNNSFFAHIPPVDWKYKPQFITLTPDFKIASRTDYGFAMHSRVSPRKIKAIVIKPQEYTVTSNNIILNQREVLKLVYLVRNILKSTGCPDLPIYDIAGNLWHPRMICYDEIKSQIKHGETI